MPAASVLLCLAGERYAWLSLVALLGKRRHTEADLFMALAALSTLRRKH